VVSHQAKWGLSPNWHSFPVFAFHSARQNCNVTPSEAQFPCWLCRAKLCPVVSPFLQHTLMAGPTVQTSVFLLADYTLFYTSDPSPLIRRSGVDIRRRELVTGEVSLQGCLKGNVFSSCSESTGFVLTSKRVTEVDLRQKCGEASGNDCFCQAGRPDSFFLTHNWNSYGGNWEIIRWCVEFSLHLQLLS